MRNGKTVNFTPNRLYRRDKIVPMKQRADNQIEILYVSGSSLDRRGKRILVREHGTENYIFPEDGIDAVDVKLLGLSEDDQRHIERFFGV